MNSFDVLDRATDIHRSYFLEASAGTGKTFSIENLFTRFLLEAEEEQEPLEVGQILVVTFTKAATSELRMRIRKQIERAWEGLKEGDLAKLPDYLLQIAQAGTKACTDACRRLEKALAIFDEAQVFTIHSFCYRMLREYALEAEVSYERSADSEEIPYQIVLRVVKDFLRAGLIAPNYHRLQAATLMRRYKERLEETLVRELLKEQKLPNLLTYPELIQECQKLLQRRPHFMPLDLASLARGYKGICDIKGQIKEPFLEVVALLVRWLQEGTCTEEEFETMAGAGVLFLEALHPENRKSRAKEEEEGPRACLHWLTSELYPLLHSVTDPLTLLARAVQECRQLLQIRFDEEEQWTPDEILSVMRKSLQRPAFAEQIYKRYHAVVIDEFQDTDPTQWEIFTHCFFQQERQRRCYLVGDPKQSIYAFRQADIYTYLTARRFLGEGAQATLNVNYRSQPSLVAALNHLFCALPQNGWMALPKWKETLEISPVRSAPGKEDRSFGDERGSVHFFVAQGAHTHKHWPSETIELEQLFPFIAAEIAQLVRLKGLKLSSFAILVKDRYQALRLQNYLKQWQIAAVTLKSRSLLDSVAFGALRDLLLALEEPLDRCRIRAVLGGALFRWQHGQIVALNDPILEQRVVALFFQWRELLETRGFAYVFSEILHAKVGEHSLAIVESLLSEESGYQIYRELQRLFDLIVERENQIGRSVSHLIHYLHELTLHPPDDELLRLPPDESEQAVQIITVHMSKGLEFDIVFALGLASRTLQEDSLQERFSEDRSALKEEKDAEKMRQLYVAFTRAKWRLYIPLLFDSRGRSLELGQLSPVELFCAHLLPSAENPEELVAHLQEAAGPMQITLSHCALKPEAQKLARSLSQTVLQEPLPFTASYPAKYVTSYSALAAQLRVYSEESLVKKSAPSDALPLGSETGNALHLVLEKIDYKAVAQAAAASELEALVAPLLAATTLRDWVPQVAAMVYTTLRTPLIIDGRALILAELPSNRRWHEMEFLYPIETGFCTGFIDLFFEWDGSYYLLDWKSNYLGSDPSDYAPEKLQEVMEAEKYTLQAQIYAQAIGRYLRACGATAPFGGVIYLFLRGGYLVWRQA